MTLQKITMDASWRLMNSDSAIFCYGKENMNSYKENKKHKDGTKIQFCAIFALCEKMAQDYLHK
jgi:hypothetical protein